jgi:hypothetical protein
VAKSLLFAQTQTLAEPPGCGPGRQEVKTTFKKGGRLYTITMRDKVIVEDSYLVAVKAVAFAVQQSEPYMGREVPRAWKDFLLKSSVVI